jgi:O-antigen/teichoic acid export membrane protein
MRIARNSALLAAGDITGLAFGFISTILVTDRLGADYGLFVGAQRFVGLFVVIVQFGLYPLLVRSFAAGRGDPGALFGTALLLRIVFGSLFAVVVPVAAAFTGYLPGQRWLLLAFVGTEFLGVIAETFMARCEGFENFGRSALIAISRSSSTFIGVLAVSFLGGGLPAFVGVYVVSRLIQVGVGAVLVARSQPRLTLRIDLGTVRPLLREAAWFVGVGLTATLQSTIAVMMLTRFSTAAETARFGAGLNFLDVVLVLPVLLQRALLPAFSRLSRTGGAAAIAENSLRLIPAVLIPAGVGMSCLAEPIMRLYPSGDFASAAPVFRMMALWLVFQSAAHVSAAFLTGMGRLRALIGINLLGVTFQAVVLFFAIPRAGADGAAATTLAAHALTAVTFLTLSRQSGVSIPWRSFLRIAVSALAMAAALLPLRALPLPIAVAGGALVYFAAMALLLPRDSLERRLVASLAERVRSRLRR